MKLLTKEDILKGKDQRITLYIKEYDANVVIRPLTDGELTTLLSKISVLKVGKDGTPQLEGVNLSQHLEILRSAALLGLVEPKLTEEDLASMKFGVPEFIGMKILEISGLLPPEEALKKSR